MIEWLRAMDAITAATVALSIVAGVQIGREIYRDRQRLAGIRRRLLGAAWLARRSCDVTIRSAPGRQNSYAIATSFTRVPQLDRLQRHFQNVLVLSSAAGGALAEHGTKAFESFLAAADRFNEALHPSTPATTSMTAGIDLVEEALFCLHDAVIELEHLAPRRPHEVALPSRATLRQSRPPGPPPTALQPREPPEK